MNKNVRISKAEVPLQSDSSTRPDWHTHRRRASRGRHFWACVSLLIFGVSFVCSMSAALGATYYVNAKVGSDSSSGLTAKQPFLTINRACGSVHPGDTVIIYPGIYFETVNLWTSGTLAQPITFKGYTRTRNNEIITGANAAFRNGKVSWTLANSSMSIYSAPCSWLPARVLYDDVDLFPYASLNDLETFTTDGTTPGPLHGFFYDSAAHTIYLRLNPKYGSLSPNQHTMMVGPPNGGGSSGKVIQATTDTNFVIHTSGTANVIIDGLTFETPGVAGIATKASNLTVQDCNFIGCRSAVYGLGDPTNISTSINNVVVQYCEYSLFPSFDDMADEIETAFKNPKLSLGQYWWWQRKTLNYTYELGLVLGVGSGWKILNNYIHDVVDAISGWGTTYSTNLEISNNVIVRTVDNAVEAGKSHQVNEIVQDNVMLDCFEAISYQPMEGLPWPASIWVAHNVIADTAVNANPWKHMPWERGAFKFVVDPSNWNYSYMANVSKAALFIPGSGFIANNNTVLNYNGNVFDLGGLDPMKLTNVHMINNLFVAYYAFAEAFRNSTTFDFSGFDCQGNVVASASNNIPGAGPRVAGLYGKFLLFYSQAQLINPFSYNFSPASASPLLNAGVSFSAGYNPSANVGAASLNAMTKLPVSGVQPDAGKGQNIPTP
jgi:hypothetical protein